jgi:hypothetical protein
VILKGIVDKVDVQRNRWGKESGQKKYGITLLNEKMTKLGRAEVWSYENFGVGEEVEVKIEKKAV